MMDEAKLADQVRRGAGAEVELRITHEAFANLKTELTTAWLATSPLDSAGREKLWLATTVLTRVENALRSAVANGHVADAELEAIRKAGDPKKRFGIF